MPQFHRLRMSLLFVVTFFMSVVMVSAIAADAPQKSTPVVATEGFKFRPMTDEERDSAMCVFGATAGMVTSYIIGPSEVIMLVVGGAIVPSSSSILFWGLFGTVAAAGCAIGQLATPATSWLYNHYSTSN